MNVMDVINKLKSVNLLSNDDMQTFSDSFSKFGISILLLNDLDKFNAIIDLLVSNNISIKKSNGAYDLRIFSVSYNDISNIIEKFKNLDELDFLRQNIEYISKTSDINKIIQNMSIYKSAGKEFKNGDVYDLALLLKEDGKEEIKNPVSDEAIITSDSAFLISLNEYLKKYLNDSSIVDKLASDIVSSGSVNMELDLILQKVENKISEEFLFPVNDGWKIVINKQEINSFQNAKKTIESLTKLNIPISYNDALLLILFYDSSISLNTLDEILNSNLLGGA